MLVAAHDRQLQQAVIFPALLQYHAFLLKLFGVTSTVSLILAGRLERRRLLVGETVTPVSCLPLISVITVDFAGPVGITGCFK